MKRSGFAEFAFAETITPGAITVAALNQLP
jgi:hypothetical protein